MLDDHRRKAVAAVGDFGDRASLASASLPSYPVTLTKPTGRVRPGSFRFLCSKRASDWDRPCGVPPSSAPIGGSTRRTVISGSQRGGGSRSFLGHPCLAQAGEIGGFVQCADLRHAPIAASK